MAVKRGDGKNKNIVLFVLDTLRADRMGCYGYFRDTCPTIDKLASEGVLFENAHCTGFSTGNAFSCIHSGLPAIKHKYYATPASACNVMNFDDTIPTLAEIIQSTTGHTTVAVDNLINFAGHMKQTVRGYRFYLNPTGESGFPHPEYNAEDVNEMFVPWLNMYADKKPFFAFLHYWDVHQTPYQAPGFREEFNQPHNSLEGLPIRKAAAGYDYVPGWGKVGEIVHNVSLTQKAEQVDGGFGGSMKGKPDEKDLSQDRYDCALKYMDSKIAEVIETLKQKNVLDDTIIIITADHGEGLGNHSTWGHGLPYEDTIHIPFIIWRPGMVPQGKRIDGFTQHIDIPTTIIDLLGHDATDGSIISHNGDRYTSWQDYGKNDSKVEMCGLSLLPVISGEKGLPDNMVTEIRRGPKDKGYRVYREGDWKLIRSMLGERELYNVIDDPMEKVNLADVNKAKADDLSAKLDKWIDSYLNGKEDPILVWPLPKE